MSIKQYDMVTNTVSSSHSNSYKYVSSICTEFWSLVLRYLGWEIYLIEMFNSVTQYFFDKYLYVTGSF